MLDEETVAELRKEKENELEEFVGYTVLRTAYGKMGESGWYGDMPKHCLAQH